MIRKHTDNDLEQIMKIWYASSSLAHPFLKEEFVEKVKSDMRNLYIPNSETWVYKIDSNAVGFISMMGDEIAGLFVLQDYHSQGVGTKLVNFVSEFNDKLEVEVFKKNSIGRSFYSKYGFIPFKEFNHKESGEVVLRLKKS